MEVGQLLKKIRLEKNLSQKKVSEGILSRSHLSELENGKYYCSYDKFLMLLRRLNISLLEFEERLEESKLRIEDFNLVRFVQIVNSNDVEKIRTLQKNIDEQIKLDHHSIRLEHLSILCSLLVDYHNNGKITNSTELNMLKSYLGNINSWGVYEYNLIINSLFIFDLSDCIALSKKLMKKLPTNPYSRLTKSRICLLINLSDLLIKNELYELSINLCKEAIALSHSQNLVYEKCLGIFNQSIAETYQGTNLSYEIDEYIHFFTLLGYKQLVENIQLELKLATMKNKSN